MITLKYALICDEVRREDNGKLIIIGMYTPNMAVPQLPFVLPQLTLFVHLESDATGHAGLHMKLQRLEDGQTLVEAHGGLVFQRPGGGLSHLTFGNVRFMAAGAYNFILEIEGQKEPLIVPFNVILKPPSGAGGR